ncbi:MAG: leucine-rich repeat domain-containing protein [Clostridia bacterium]|nr:leucine-rich repeat domain-containing protein [Clostridia bacterium]
MKKYVILALALLMLFILISCNNTSDDIEECKIIDGEVIITYSDGRTENAGRLSEENRGAEGLDFYLLQDLTYAVRFNGDNGVKNIVIPDTYNGRPVTEIMKSAFSNNKTIETIVIGKNVKAIKKYAFEGCENLKSITIPKGVEQCGEWVFSLCPNLAVINCEAESLPTDWDKDWLGGCEAEVHFGNNGN